MSWISLILTTINALTSIIKWRQQQQAIKAAEDAMLAKATLRMLEATETGRVLRERIADLDDQQAEALWREMVK